MKTTKAIIFDWFNVCTKENWSDCIARELNRKIGVKVEVVKAEFKKLLPDFSSGKIGSDEFLEKLIYFLDKSRNPQEFRYLFNIIPELNEELLNKIVELKKKYKIYLLTGNFKDVFLNYKDKIEFEKYFDKVFLSYELGFSKGDNNIWNVVISEIGLQPNEMIFIDDKEKYLEYPKKLGVNTILFENNEQILREIAKITPQR